MADDPNADDALDEDEDDHQQLDLATAQWPSEITHRPPDMENYRAVFVDVVH